MNFGACELKILKNSSAREKTSFLNLWSFDPDSWKFKYGVENTWKFVFRSYLERFSLQMPKMLENGCLFGPVSSKCSNMASARQKMSFLSLWSFGLNSWWFKSWAENAWKSAFRSYLERFSLQMTKMLENGCLFGPVNSKCFKMGSARQKWASWVFEVSALILDNSSLELEMPEN